MVNGINLIQQRDRASSVDKHPQGKGQLYNTLGQLKRLDSLTKRKSRSRRNLASKTNLTAVAPKPPSHMEIEMHRRLSTFEEAKCERDTMRSIVSSLFEEDLDEFKKESESERTKRRSFFGSLFKGDSQEDFKKEAQSERTRSRISLFSSVRNQIPEKNIRRSTGELSEPLSAEEDSQEVDNEEFSFWKTEVTRKDRVKEILKAIEREVRR